MPIYIQDRARYESYIFNFNNNFNDNFSDN
jgi:hypothetical protein